MFASRGTLIVLTINPTETFIITNICTTDTELNAFKPLENILNPNDKFMNLASVVDIKGMVCLETISRTKTSCKSKRTAVQIYAPNGFHIIYLSSKHQHLHDLLSKFITPTIARLLQHVLRCNRLSHIAIA